MTETNGSARWSDKTHVRSISIRDSSEDQAERLISAGYATSVSDAVRVALTIACDVIERISATMTDVRATLAELRR